MREFLLFSRQGYTSGNFRNLKEARLDLVAHSLTSSFFLSHALRKDVVFHIVLSGPPNPPVYIKVVGAELYNVRSDEETWGRILRAVLNKEKHEGFYLEKKSFQGVIKDLTNEGKRFLVLEEKGEDILKYKLKGNEVFVLGDFIGLPKKEEGFVLRNGDKISLGKKAYLAADCITILNFVMDKFYKH